MSNLLYIAVGGALGSILRYASVEYILNILRQSNYGAFPFYTMFVNVLGSLLAGCLYYFIIKNFDNFDIGLKNFLMVGFLGSYTTFSAFSLDFLRLFNASQYSYAILYVVSTLILSVLAIFLGFYLMRVVF